MSKMGVVRRTPDPGLFDLYRQLEVELSTERLDLGNEGFKVITWDRTDLDPENSPTGGDVIDARFTHIEIGESS